MKIKCKQCHKKFRVTHVNEIVCAEPTCRVKYGITGETLNFKDVKLPTVTIVANFTTPDPIVNTSGKEMTTEEWVKWCEENPEWNSYSG